MDEQISEEESLAQFETIDTDKVILLSNLSSEGRTDQL